MGEPAVDAGDPLREYFHLLVGEICKNNTLFLGDVKDHIPVHNVLVDTKHTFKSVGCMLGASLINGGPSLPSLQLWLQTA